jgi:hypothetical protein
MAVGEQADGQAFYKISLTDDDFADFSEKRPHKGAGPLDGIIDSANTCIHFMANMLPTDGQKNQKIRSEKNSREMWHFWLSRGQFSNESRKSPENRDVPAVASG